MSDVLKYWPIDENGRCKAIRKKIQGENLQHKNLLWLYRNSIVHEYRNPGQGAERSKTLEDEPYYQQISKFDELSADIGLKFTNRWELIYPTGFFLRLANTALKNVANYHLENGSSPFAAYSKGSYWIPKFNEESS